MNKAARRTRNTLLVVVALVVVMLAVLLSALASHAAGTTTILAGGGDIATCSGSTCPAKKTADQVNTILNNDPTARAVTMGDMAYPDGTASDFKNKYGPTWGQFKAKTYPVVGNHEYYCCGTGKPSAAINYFSTGAAHDLTPTYYAVDMNPNLKFLALDANKSESGKATGAPDCATETNWLITQLKAAQNGTPSDPTDDMDTVLAYHEPRYTNGTSHQSDSTGCPRTFFDAAYDYGGDVVINGHSHNYERFGAMNKSNGQVADGAGPYEIVAGTGGANFDGFVSPLKTPSDVRLKEHGVLQLTQDTDGSGFTFKFLATGAGVHDSGTIPAR